MTNVSGSLRDNRIPYEGDEWFSATPLPSLEMAQETPTKQENFNLDPPSPPTETVSTLSIRDSAIDGGEPYATVPLPYTRYRCVQHNPLECTVALQASQQVPPETACPTCGFPAPLGEGTEMQGRKGQYRIEKWCGARGFGWLYAAIEVTSGQKVAVKEYLLPDRYFNQDEARLRQTSFANVAGLDLADGRSPDLRLISPTEAIVDRRLQRCYAITNPLNLAPTLSSRLRDEQPLPPKQVRILLHQVLQTLECLHDQKFRLPSGQVQAGICCGNLGLERLLWVDRDGLPFVYLCDLSLWEDLFAPQTNVVQKHSPAEDLEALGYVGYALLTGAPIQPQVQAAELAELLEGDEGWTPATQPLQQFVERLLGIGVPFASAAEARQQLPPPEIAEPAPIPAIEPDVPPEQRQSRKSLLLLAIALALIAIGLAVPIAVMLMKWLRPADLQQPASVPLLNRWSDVGSVPAGRYRYTAIDGGIWDTVRWLAQRGDKDLEMQLSGLQPQLDLDFDPNRNWAAAIEAVETGRADFALLPLVGELPPSLTSQTIAYDGIAILVAFSTSQRDNSLPEGLNGRLKLDQVRQLYGGRVDTWESLGGPNLSVQLYRPTSAEATYVFDRLVMQSSQVRRRLPPLELMQTILRDFEDSSPRGGLGFLQLSLAFNQCSVYPLAIGAEGSPPVQALVTANGRPIQPTTNLCGLKGNYFLPSDRFQRNSDSRYPLAYAFGVVYPLDNSLPPIGEKFAELFATREGQTLLQQAGLVPLDSAALSR